MIRDLPKSPTRLRLRWKKNSSADLQARSVRERKRRGPAVSGSRERRGEGAADWAGRALAWAELGSWASCRAGTKGTAGGGEKKSWVEVGRNQVGEVLICLFFFFFYFQTFLKLI